MNYILKLVNTDATTGYFEVVPEDDIDFDTAVEILHKRPLDDFLHRYVLHFLTEFNDEQVSALIRKAVNDGDLILQSIGCERILLSGSLSRAKKFFSEKTIKKLKKISPLINIRSALGNNTRLNAKWISLFKENIIFHKELPSLHDSGISPVCAGDCSVKKQLGLTIKDLYQNYAGSTGEKFPEGQTIKTALKRLENAGIVLKKEMRHESSLSPFALLRQWEFNIRIENMRNIFSLSGRQTSYGKGLTLEQSRASLTMEIVERCSAFASISSCGVEGFVRKYPMFYGSYTKVLSEGKKAVNPDEIALEIRYDNEPVHWIEGTTAVRCPDRNISEKALVPVQAVFLFSNLDEIDLFSGLGSTGLASGNTMEQAKVAALLEIIERHQEAVVPFETSRCFRLVVEDREKNNTLARLLESYYSLGIDLLFQDITPEYGVPCCKCFVTGIDGKIYKGTAAGLNAKKAIISAITETNYPFPKGPVSAKGPDDLIVVGFENLPDYSGSDYASDLALLEQVLISNGLRPYYVDLTRRDIGLPVVKAIIPGMEIMGDFDAFSRVHPELFQNYLKSDINAK